MFDIVRSDPDMFWLNFTNIGLGVLALLAVAVVAAAFLREALARHRARATATDTEVSALGGHAFHVPGLGLTMADGGEEEQQQKPKTSRPRN